MIFNVPYLVFLFCVIALFESDAFDVGFFFNLQRIYFAKPHRLCRFVFSTPRKMNLDGGLFMGGSTREQVEANEKMRRKKEGKTLIIVWIWTKKNLLLFFISLWQFIHVGGFAYNIAPSRTRFNIQVEEEMAIKRFLILFFMVYLDCLFITRGISPGPAICETETLYRKNVVKVFVERSFFMIR